MKTLTVRLPEALAQEIEAESKARKILTSQVEVVRGVSYGFGPMPAASSA
jgi:hypothetical protein